jgi:predicted DNA-binding antitoxin AbrB/MazE fold protein
MTQAVDAIFENGVFKPLTPPNILEHQKVHLLVEVSQASESGHSKAAERLMNTLRAVERPLGGKPWAKRDDLYER